MDQIVEGVGRTLPTGIRWSPVRPGGVTDVAAAGDGRLMPVIVTGVLLAVVAVMALVLARRRQADA